MKHYVFKMHSGYKKIILSTSIFLLFSNLLSAQNSDPLYISKNGNVGIGTNVPSSSLEVNGSFGMKTTTVVVNTVLDSSHSIIFCNNISAITVTLPSATGIDGRIYQVKLLNNGDVNITTMEGQTIDGDTAVHLVLQNATMQFVSNGSNWFVLNSFGTTPHYIGEKFGGGIIFYVDHTRRHGLIVAENVQGIATDDCIVDSAGVGDTSLGAGLANTNALTKACPGKNTGARICDTLELNGYNDWFLPSVGEMRLIYVNLKSKNPTFFNNNFYISSSRPDFKLLGVAFSYFVTFKPGSIKILGEGHQINSPDIDVYIGVNGYEKSYRPGWQRKSLPLGRPQPPHPPEIVTSETGPSNVLPIRAF